MDASFVLLLVADPARSATFYERLLGRPPFEQTPTFAAFKLNAATTLGLWSQRTVEPAMNGKPGASDLCFEVEDVDRVHADWQASGIPILAAPADLDFGRTFLGLDPDGHRLRVMKLGEPA
jgi:predicted enzyme related to lactoylglutathione lyase